MVGTFILTFTTNLEPPINLGLWEETGALRGHLHRHAEIMQAPHKDLSWPAGSK